MCGIVSLSLLCCLNLLQPSDVQLMNCIFPIIVIIEFYVDVHTNLSRVSCSKLHIVSNSNILYIFSKVLISSSNPLTFLASSKTILFELESFYVSSLFIFVF